MSVVEISDELDSIVEESILDAVADVEAEAVESEKLLRYVKNEMKYKVHRVKKEIETFWDKVLLVAGYFGVQKTLSTLSAVEVLLKRRDDVVWAVASPLRALRNKMSKVFKTNVFVMKAHDELVKRVSEDAVVEEPLRIHLRDVLRRMKMQVGRELSNQEKQRSYFTALHEHRVEVKKGNEDCWWVGEVSALIDYVKAGGRIVVTTHGLLPAVYSILRSYFKFLKLRTVIDEAEDFFERVSAGFPAEELEFLRKLDYRIYYNMKRFFFSHEESKNLLFVRRELLYNIIRNSVLISATMPPSLLDSVELFLRTMEVRMNKKSEYPIIKTYTMRSADGVKDIVLLYDRVMSWDETKELMPTIKKLTIPVVERSVRKYGCVGILSRRYDMSRDFYDFFTRHLGYRTFSDHPESEDMQMIKKGKWSLRVETDKNIIMVMVSGPLKKGIDIIPRSSKTGDVKVMLGFFQGAEDARVHPDILSEMVGGLPLYDADEYPDEITIIEKYKNEKLYAKNLQSLHRFSRIRSNQHIYILLDKRWEESFEKYFYWRYWYEIERMKFGDLEELFKKANEII